MDNSNQAISVLRGKEPSLIVLKYLLSGHELRYQGQTYAGREGNIVILLYRDGIETKSNERPVGPCLSINQFLQMCDSFSEEELICFSADNALQDLMLSKVKDRSRHQKIASEWREE